MTPSEFEAAYNRVLDGLSSEDREMIEAIIAGAQVIYTAVYMVVTAVLGAVAGWSLCALIH